MHLIENVEIPCLSKAEGIVFLFFDRTTSCDKTMSRTRLNMNWYNINWNYILICRAIRNYNIVNFRVEFYMYTFQYLMDRLCLIDVKTFSLFLFIRRINYNEKFDSIKETGQEWRSIWRRMSLKRCL